MQNRDKIKICFVARGLTKGGVYRFIKNILLEIDGLDDKNYEFYLIHDDLRFQNIFENIKEIYVKSDNKLLFDYIFSFSTILKNNFDVIIYPKNVIPLNHFLLKGKKVNVVHDLGYFEPSLNAYPFLDTLFMKTFMKASCKLSNRVLAVSKFTKNDIHEKFKIKKEKIEVIHEGVERRC